MRNRRLLPLWVIKNKKGLRGSRAHPPVYFATITRRYILPKILHFYSFNFRLWIEYGMAYIRIPCKVLYESYFLKSL